ncbi:hypothetical protein BDR26DRAFT_852572 [Obelidium mucronatum]|nr:hypothetical protein BDR26DRAFT_852572 [Obelidium mucronatum]
MNQHFVPSQPAVPVEWAAQYQQFVIPSSTTLTSLEARSFSHDSTASTGSHLAGSLSPVSATTNGIAQNRASQKTYREKQQAYVKSLEDKVALCEATHSGVNGGGNSGHAQSPQGLTYNNVAVTPTGLNSFNSNSANVSNVSNSLEWTQRVTTLEIDNLKLKADLAAYTEAIRNQTRKIEQQDAIIQQYQSMALTLMSAPPKPELPLSNNSLFQDPFSILSYPSLNPGFTSPSMSAPMDSTATLSNNSYYPTTVPSQPAANINNNGLSAMQSSDSLTTLAQRTSGFFNLASSGSFGFLNGPPPTSAFVPSSSSSSATPPFQATRSESSATPSLRTKPSVTSNLSDNWDFAQLDSLPSQERTDVGRRLLKTVPSLQNENGARLVDDLCDMFNEMTVRPPSPFPGRVPTPERIDKNLIKICMTKLQILEACTEEDQERVIQLTQYTGKKNDFVKKHFTGFVRIIRNTIGLGRQQQQT